MKSILPLPQTTRWFCALLAVLASAFIARGEAAGNSKPRFSQVVVTFDERADDTTRKAAEICRRWIERRSGATVAVRPGPAGHNAGTLEIRLGHGSADTALCGFFFKRLRDLPDARNPGPEGFALLSDLRLTTVAIAGVDLRGVIYGAGELLLRQLEYLEDGVALHEVDLASAPAFPVRGGNAAHISTQIQPIMPVREWTQEEWEDYAIYQMLNGANNFDIGRLNAYNFPQKHYDAYDFFRAHGMEVTTGSRLNQLPGHPEWRGSEGGDWVCPSIPEARAALLEQMERQFSALPYYDYLRLYSGDPGGCRCDRCQPSWGAVYIRLCEEAAVIWHKYHPGSRVIITNQELTNEGDQAIFDYAREKQPSWLHAVNYGPGSNAMSTYYKPELRKDLFVYPRLGKEVRYLEEIRAQLPPQYRIIHFSDITHWIQSQFGYEVVDPVQAAAYGRRNLYMTPRRYREIFHQIMAFADGDLPYTEGMHDHFNHHLWLRWLWNPQLSAEEATAEYARFRFGRQAAPEMVQAILQWEEGITLPLQGNETVSQFHRLVFSAREKIPPHLREIDAWWSLIAQQAVYDLYLQQAEERALAQNRTIVEWLKPVSDAGGLIAVISRIEKLLAEQDPKLLALRQQVRALGDDSERNIAFRSVGYYRPDPDYAGNHWLMRQLKQLAMRDDTVTFAGRLRRLLEHGQVGAEEFYENPGVPGGAPHFVRGRQRAAISRGMSDENRLSQNSAAYSHRRAEGVAFDFRGLDADAPYELRLTLAAAGEGFRQRVRVNGRVVSDWLEVPVARAQDVIVVVPPELTRSRRLFLELEPAPGSRGTTVAELWVLKRRVCTE